MLTNVIAYLHTTLAYQSAAMQLMAGQANFDAQQLHLRETLPVVAPADTNAWSVAAPPDGVTGGFATPNYFYKFVGGKLVSIQRKARPRGAPADAAELQPSLIDTNGAYELARQWLTAISVDVPALESKHPHNVMEFAQRPPMAHERNRARAGVTNRPPERVIAAPNKSTATPPIFRVTWGGRNPGLPSASTAVQVTMEILGSTKQCIGLRIQNPELVKAPPLQVTNAAKLLGTPPPPQHFVEEFLGGPEACATVARPDRVAAWLLGSQPDEPDKKIARTPAVAADANTAALLARTLTDFNAYSWLEEKGGLPEYQAAVRFTKGNDTVEFLISFESDQLQVTHDGRVAEKDCDGAHIALVQAIKAVFPRDEVVKNLSPLPNQPK